MIFRTPIAKDVDATVQQVKKELTGCRKLCEDTVFEVIMGNVRDKIAQMEVAFE